MPRSAPQLRLDAEEIWWAGVAGVAPERLIREQVAVDGQTLFIADEMVDLGGVNRIAVVGGGKAAGGMAAALEEALGPRLLAEKDVVGWVNVPADCVRRTQRVMLYAGRPAGVNEPRPEGVAGTRKILELVRSLQPNDLCLCVIAGGGSALLPAPVPGVSLDDKITLTRLLSAAGANIEQLNRVRRELSGIKGGGLARACGAKRLIALIISDVLGDPIDLIASGPTVVPPDDGVSALVVLEELRLLDDPSIDPIVRYLKSVDREKQGKGRPIDRTALPEVTNVILANNATAVDAAGLEAERRGYSHAMICATKPEGSAEEVGRHLADMALRMRAEPGPDCLLSGGEPTVTLIDESLRGQGGRNQQLALAALTRLSDCSGVSLLSGGTDGEDGPTDAAGAIVTAEIVAQARAHGLDPRDFLDRNDAYTFFSACGGLLKTGPTLTNVGDLRVVTVEREA